MRGFRVQGSGFGAQCAGQRAVAACCLLAVGCVVLAGCGGSKLDTVTVTGRVTYGGGDWPKPGNIDFTPKEAAKGNLHPGSGSFGTDGRFSVKSGQASGLVPGTYGVRIECWETPPSMENPSAAKSYVPEKYRNAATSGLTLEIKAGESSKEFTADIPKQ
jgi:hypothetical protein